MKDTNVPVEKKYMVSKAECQRKINSLGNVCDRCGRKIVPLETVDNSGNPTYWAGCYHGSRGKNASGHFTNGVKPDVFILAEKLVCDGMVIYGNKSDYKETPESRLYWFQQEVAGVCSTINRIEWMKSGKPRKTKEEVLNDDYF
jgi:hypothetical protein